jgi:hypothetical protein
MISPYRSEIRHLKETVIDRIEDVDYEIADICFNKLSKFYLLEYIFYLRVLEEESEKEEELKTGTLEELSIVMDKWREIIGLQEKWGTIR